MSVICDSWQTPFNHTRVYVDQVVLGRPLSSLRMRASCWISWVIRGLWFFKKYLSYVFTYLAALSPSCGMQDLWSSLHHARSLVTACKTPSCDMWDLVPWPGIKPGTLRGECEILATGPPGKSRSAENFSVPLPTHTSREGRGAGDWISLQWLRFNQLCLDNEPSIKNPKGSSESFPSGQRRLCSHAGRVAHPRLHGDRSFCGQDPSEPRPVYLYSFIPFNILSNNLVT